MATTLRSTLILTFILLLIACSAVSAPPPYAEYSPRDFFRSSPVDLFFTEDEMSEADKAAIITNNFTQAPSFSCTEWGVATESATSLTLKYCQDSYVRIQVYPGTSTDTIVAVESNRSGGRAVDLTFFKVAAANKSIAPLTPEERTGIGLSSITENDFLQESQKFKSEDVKMTAFYLEEDGTVQASLNNWMDPRWEGKEASFSVRLAWNGASFKKQVVPRSSTNP